MNKRQIQVKKKDIERKLEIEQKVRRILSVITMDDYNEENFKWKPVKFEGVKRSSFKDDEPLKLKREREEAMIGERRNNQIKKKLPPLQSYQSQQQSKVRVKPLFKTNPTNGIAVNASGVNPQYVDGLESLKSIGTQSSSGTWCIDSKKTFFDQHAIDYEYSLFKKGEFKDWLKLKIRRELCQLKLFVGNNINKILKNKSMFPMLWQLHIGCELSYPTSVICESTFSLMKRVKTPQRCRMKDDTLESILRIKYATEDDIISTIDRLMGSR